MSDATNAQRTDGPTVLTDSNSPHEKPLNMTDLRIGLVVKRLNTASSGQPKSGVISGEPHLRTITHGHQTMMVPVTPVSTGGEHMKKESWFLGDLGVMWATESLSSGVSRASR